MPRLWPKVIAFLLLWQITATVYAVEIITVRATNAGVNVEVEAVVQWQPPRRPGRPYLDLEQLAQANSRFKLSRTVQAELLSSDTVTWPPLPTTFVMKHQGGGRYVASFESEVLPAKSYGVRVTATQEVSQRRMAPPSGTGLLGRYTIQTDGSQDTETASFVIPAPAGCFRFNERGDMEGWTVDGPFEGRDGVQESVPLEGPVSPLLTWASSAGFGSPSNTDDSGGLSLFFPRRMLPNNIPADLEFFRVDLHSPKLDVEEHSAWQGDLKGVSVRVLATFEDIAGFYIQPLITVRYPDGTDHTFIALNGIDDGSLRGSGIDGSYKMYAVYLGNLPVPPKSKIVGVQLRLFKPVNPFSGGVFYVDEICPWR